VPIRREKERWREGRGGRDRQRDNGRCFPPTSQEEKGVGLPRGVSSSRSLSTGAGGPP